MLVIKSGVEYTRVLSLLSFSPVPPSPPPHFPVSPRLSSDEAVSLSIGTTPETKKTPKITACYCQGKATGPMIMELENSWFSRDYESVSFHYRETICKARRLRSLSHSKTGNRTRGTSTSFAMWLRCSDIAMLRVLAPITNVSCNK